jgi:hypothetical protein
VDGDNVRVVAGDDEQLVELWRRGVPVREIGRRIGRSPGRVSVRARRLGMEPRQPRPAPHDHAHFTKLYSRGFTIAAIAHRTSYHRDTVRKSLVASGVELRGAWRKWPVRHDAFTPPQSTEAWYWIGLLAADGYVRGAEVTLIQKCSSESLLRRFLAFVGSKDRPLRPINQRRAWAAHVSSPQIVADLAAHGIVRRKSYTLKASEEAADQPAFWLGVFDGDGCISFDRKAAPNIGIVGTHALMSQYSRFAHEIVGYQPVVGRQRAGQDTLWEVRLAGDRARQMAELWLPLTEVGLEAKRARLERAAEYVSRMTRARLGARRRRCDYCGAWLERKFPSQLHDHVFCSSSHFGKWNIARRREQISVSPNRSDSGQLQLSPLGL